jgi:hypothetical protein
VDLQQRIQLIIDAKNATKKPLQEVSKDLEKVATQAGVQGKATGDKFGQEMARAQDRWIKVSQGFLRNYFGSWGRGLAEVLEHYDKIGKAIESTNKAAALKGGGSAVAGAAAGKAVASKEASLLATGAAAGVGTVAVPKGWRELKKLIDDRKAANQMALAFGHQPPNPGAIQTTLQYLGQGAKRAVTGGAFGAAGAIGGGLVGAAGIIGLAGSRSATNEARAKEIASAKLLIDEVNKIKDPIERTKKIISELGADGQAEFRKLSEEVAKYNKEQSKAFDARGFQFASKVLVDSAKSIGSAILGLFGKIGGAYASLANNIAGLFGQKVSKSLLDSIAAGEAESDRLQKKLDQKRIDRIKKDEDEKKKADQDLADLVDSQDDLTTAVEKTALANADNVQKIEMLKKKQLEFNQALMWTERGTMRHNRLLKDQLDLQDDLNDAKKKANEDLVAKEDKQRLSLSELAGMTGANAKKAQDILGIEDRAKQAIANGDRFGANNLSKQAEQLRRQLGQAGILQSGDFTVGSQKFSNNKRVSLAEMLQKNPDLLDEYQRLFALQTASRNPNLNFKQQFNLKEQMEAVQAKITETLEDRRSKDATNLMAEDYKRLGALRVIPYNGP